MKFKLLRSPFVHLALIAILGLLAYSNTFNVPFQWDEEYFIVDNPIIRDLDYFADLSRAEGLMRYDALKNRYIGYLTFALNYWAHGLNVKGYHIVNILIHILNAFLVYLLVVVTFKTPFLKGAPLASQSKYIALFSGLLFISHPIHIEAVTYIFQRLASLVTFFYLLSVCSYIGSRLSKGKRKVIALYILSLVSAVFAMKTKENAFTLPIVITLYELSFFRGHLRARIIRLLPLILTMLIIPLTLAAIGKPAGVALSEIIAVPQGYVGLSRTEYLLTQLRVIPMYIRLLFLPVNQSIDYDYPIFHTFLNLRVILSSTLLLSILTLGLFSMYRSRNNPAFRLISFGIFWFFITLSVESSIVPIPMVINEYRMYLPSPGAFIAILTVCFILPWRQSRPRTIKIATILLTTLPLVLATATYARNTVWRSETCLWEDTVEKSPANARAYWVLGISYNSEGLIDKSESAFREAINLKPGYAPPYINMGHLYTIKRSYDKALRYFQTALELAPDLKDAVDAYNGIGIVYYHKGAPDAAIEAFQAALRLNPDSAEAHSNLGNIYYKKGLFDKAAEHYHIAIRLKPDYASAHFNLGLLYLKMGLKSAAYKEFEKALELNPDFKEARQYLDDINASHIQ